MSEESWERYAPERAEHEELARQEHADAMTQSDPSPLGIAALKAAAEKAQAYSSGEWVSEYVPVDPNRKHDPEMFHGYTINAVLPNEPADDNQMWLASLGSADESTPEYIAKMCPATVLRLLDVLEAAQEQLADEKAAHERIWQANGELHASLVVALAERDAAQAALAAAQAEAHELHLQALGLQHVCDHRYEIMMELQTERNAARGELILTKNDLETWHKHALEMETDRNVTQGQLDDAVAALAALREAMGEEWYQSTGNELPRSCLECEAWQYDGHRAWCNRGKAFAAIRAIDPAQVAKGGER